MNLGGVGCKILISCVLKYPRPNHNDLLVVHGALHHRDVPHLRIPIAHSEFMVVNTSLEVTNRNKHIKPLLLYLTGLYSFLLTVFKAVYEHLGCWVWYYLVC